MIFLIWLIMIAWFFVGVIQLGDFLRHIPILFSNINPTASRKYRTHGLALLTYFIVGFCLIYFDMFNAALIIIFLFVIPIGFIFNWRVIKLEMKHKVHTEEIIDDILTY